MRTSWERQTRWGGLLGFTLSALFGLLLGASIPTRLAAHPSGSDPRPPARPLFTPFPTSTPPPTLTPACGLAWRQVACPSPGPYAGDALNAVAVVAQNDVWAVGEYWDSLVQDRLTLIMHWDGSNWTTVPSPNGSSTAELYGVTALAPNDARAVGFYYDPMYPFAALTLHWNGAQWSIIPNPAGTGLTAVTSTAPDDVWAVGQNTGGMGGLALHWNGAQWSVFATINGEALNGAAAVWHGDVWAVGTVISSALVAVTHYNDPCAPPTATPTGTPTGTGTPPTATGTAPSTPTPCPNSWSVLAVYPTPAAYQAAAYLGGQVYVFGGYNGPALATAYRYDPGANRWSALAALPAGRIGARAVSDGTYLYILGGQDPTFNSTNTLWRYDPQANTYQTLAPFGVATAFHAAVYQAGKIYRLAGNGTNSVEVYDIAGNQWTLAAPYPLSIAGLLVASDGRYIYAAGGTNHSLKTYRYDPTANTWDDAAIPDLPTPHEAGAAGFLGGRFIVAGGFVLGGVTNEVIAWTPGQNSWDYLPSLPLADGGGGSAAGGANLYTIGGLVSSQYVDWNQGYFDGPSVATRAGDLTSRAMGSTTPTSARAIPRPAASSPRSSTSLSWGRRPVRHTAAGAETRLAQRTPREAEALPAAPWYADAFCAPAARRGLKLPGAMWERLTLPPEQLAALT